jgi:hypothetical protein
MLARREAISMGRSGGRARTRTLSPERRREIARFARSNRWRLEKWGISEVELVKNFVHQIRASDPDLATFVKKACSMPYRFQDRLFQMLNPDEVETINRVREAIACKQ